jgi:hypothetical protein
MERMKNNLDVVDVELIKVRRTIVDMIKQLVQGTRN